MWKARLLALVLAMLPGVAAAQLPNIQDHSVWGRIGISGQAGPSQAIPFSALAKNLQLPAGQLWIGSTSGFAAPQTPSGDLLVSTGGAFTLAAVNANVGSFGAPTLCDTITVNAKGLITAISAATCTPLLGSISGFGTGVAAALAIATGSAGAFTTFNGAHGTPSSITLTSATGLPLTTGVTGTLPFANGGNNDTGTASATYTPTIACAGGGALTTSTVTGHWKQLLAKYYFVQIDLTLTNIGTCVGPITATLPNSASAPYNQTIFGRDNGNTGKAVIANILTGTSATQFRLSFYDNTTVVTNTNELVVSGVIEVQ